MSKTKRGSTPEYLSEGVARSADCGVPDVPAAGAAPTNRASRLLENSAVWLYSREHDLVESFASQLSAGRTLSKRQNEVLTDIEAKVEKRGAPRFVSGGRF